MLIVFRHMKRAIAIDFVEKIATTNRASYCQLLLARFIEWFSVKRNLSLSLSLSLSIYIYIYNLILRRISCFYWSVHLSPIQKQENSTFKPALLRFKIDIMFYFFYNLNIEQRNSNEGAFSGKISRSRIQVCAIERKAKNKDNCLQSWTINFFFKGANRSSLEVSYSQIFVMNTEFISGRDSRRN